MREFLTYPYLPSYRFVGQKIIFPGYVNIYNITEDSSVLDKEISIHPMKDS